MSAAAVAGIYLSVVAAVSLACWALEWYAARTRKSKRLGSATSCTELSDATMERLTKPAVSSKRESRSSTNQRVRVQEQIMRIYRRVKKLHRIYRPSDLDAAPACPERELSAIPESPVASTT